MTPLKWIQGKELFETAPPRCFEPDPGVWRANVHFFAKTSR
jgi:hypothetical protein